MGRGSWLAFLSVARNGPEESFANGVMMDKFDIVSSATDPAGARIRALIDGDGRRNRNEILIENETNILGALEAGVDLLHVYGSRSLEGSVVVPGLPPDIPTSFVLEEVLRKLFERTRVPDVFAVARLPARQTFRALTASTGDIVVLDALNGPGNIGSIIRIATAFEAAGIVFLNQDRTDVYRRGIVRASAGTIFKLPIVTATTVSFVRFCRASGTRIVATSAHAQGGFDEVASCPDRLALVFSSETNGCSADVEAAAHWQCRIPMSPRVESLNVSAAASVLLFARSPFARATTLQTVGSA